MLEAVEESVEFSVADKGEYTVSQVFEFLPSKSKFQFDHSACILLACASEAERRGRRHGTGSHLGGKKTKSNTTDVIADLLVVVRALLKYAVGSLSQTMALRQHRRIFTVRQFRSSSRRIDFEERVAALLGEIASSGGDSTLLRQRSGLWRKPRCSAK